MDASTVLLVNPNRMQPPVAPLGLQYVADGLRRHGHEAVLCDLAFEEDWRQALERALDDTKPSAVGISIRNIDDAYYASQEFILEKTAEVVRHARTLTDHPVILGGVGFSCAPIEVLEFTGATHGIAGEGEDALPQLLHAIARDEDLSNVPGAVFWNGQHAVMPNPPSPLALDRLAPSTRDFLDNARYFREGGQAGIETKRGCAGACIYCADPVAKGRTMRLRHPDSVADEMAALLEQGIDVLHLCDSEFNLPRTHSMAVCEAIVRRNLGDRLRWYTYASPAPFDTELALTMARAGCRGIDFGADHSDPAILKALGRPFRADAIAQAVAACREAGIAVMLDLLLGSAGETHDTVARAIDFMREIDPDRVGLSCGVRVYPHTPLAAMVRTQGPIETNPHLHGCTRDNESLLRPIFFLDAALGAELPAYVTSLLDGDRRFLHADPNETDGNYNYNDNSVLSQAIRDGARGAYWDILRNTDA